MLYGVCMLSETFNETTQRLLPHRCGLNWQPREAPYVGRYHALCERQAAFLSRCRHLVPRLLPGHAAYLSKAPCSYKRCVRLDVSVAAAAARPHLLAARLPIIRLFMVLLTFLLLLRLLLLLLLLPPPPPPLLLRVHRKPWVRTSSPRPPARHLSRT